MSINITSSFEFNMLFDVLMLMFMLMLTYVSFPGCVKNRHWRDQDTTPSITLYSHLSRLRPSTEHLLYDSKIQVRTFLWIGCNRVSQSQKNWRLMSADVVCVNYRRIPRRASALQTPSSLLPTAHPRSVKPLMKRPRVRALVPRLS